MSNISPRLADHKTKNKNFKLNLLNFLISKKIKENYFLFKIHKSP